MSQQVSSPGARLPAVTLPLTDGSAGPVAVALRIDSGDGAAVAVNTAWCRTTGLSLEDSLGAGWLEAVGAADRPPLLDAVRRTFDGTAEVCVLVAGLSGNRARWKLSAQDGGVLVVVEVGTPLVDPPRSRSEALGTLLPDIFAVTLDLTACARLADEPVRSRLATAIERLDQVVFDAHHRELRR